MGRTGKNHRTEVDRLSLIAALCSLTVVSGFNAALNQASRIFQRQRGKAAGCTPI